MSSPSLVPPSHAADRLPALLAALAQVAEESLFAFAEPCDPEAAGPLLDAREASEAWTSVTVTFHGPFEGSACFALPRALAAELCGAFSGQAPEEIDDAQIDDFAGELANMVCGLWLTQTHRSERFSLSSPRVEATTAAAVAEALRRSRSAGLATVNDTPISIELLLAETEVLAC